MTARLPLKLIIAVTHRPCFLSQNLCMDDPSSENTPMFTVRRRYNVDDHYGRNLITRVA